TLSSPNVSVGDPTAVMDSRQQSAGMTKEPMPALAVVSAAPVSAAPAADLGSSTMVEISMSKLLVGVVVAGAVLGSSFLGYRSWKKKHTARPSPTPVVRLPPSNLHRRRAGVGPLTADARPRKTANR